MAIQARPNRGGFVGHLLPQSRVGWWAVALLVGLGLSLLALYASILTGQAKGYALAVVVPVGLSIVFGLAAGAVGLIGIIAKRERSILVFAAAGVGLVFAGAWLLSGLVSGLFGAGSAPSPPPVPPRMPPLGG